jgi:adenylate cyclase
MSFEPSAELEAVARRWVSAIVDGDYQTSADLFHRGDGTRYVGSDKHEWWQGASFVDAFPQHQSEMPDFTMEVEEVEAYESGTVGWAAVKTLTAWANEAPRSFRFTLVFILESGFWQIVQAHLSIAVPNTEIMGIEMTRTLEDLLASLDSGVESQIRSSVEHGTVTLMFTDIEGSSQMAAQVGDASWVETIESHNEEIQRIVEMHTGILVKTLGDGTMTAFQSVREGAKAALSIQEFFGGRTEPPELKLRVGLHVGDVVRSGGDSLGNAVNKAARITSAGAAEEVIVSSAVKSLLSDDPEFHFGETHSLHLKGIDGMHEVASLRRGETHHA